MALVQLSVVEKRLDAVRAVLTGARVGEVAASLGVSRQSVHAWLVRHLAGGVAGLVDRSHRPPSCTHQAPEPVEIAVTEMRREHPRWVLGGSGLSCCEGRCRGLIRWSRCPRSGPSTGS